MTKGVSFSLTYSEDDNLFARKLYQEAIELDSEYGPAYEMLGWTYHHEIALGWIDDPVESLMQAEELGKKALTLGGTYAHALLMCVYSLKGQNNKAIAEGEKGLAIIGNSANFNVAFGETLSFAGRHEEAIERVNKGIRLNPHHQPLYIWILGKCYWYAGIIEKSIECFELHVQQVPNQLQPWLDLAGLYAQLGRDEEAKKAAEEVRRIAPDYSWEKYGRGFRFPDKEVERRFFDGLRKVGLK